MMKRWSDHAQTSLPLADLADALVFEQGLSNQFAPEFSQDSYAAMREMED